MVVTLASVTIEASDITRPTTAKRRHPYLSESRPEIGPRTDTRKWILSKLVPKKYGNRVTAEITGADGGPVQTEELSSMEIARRVAFLLASAGKDQESR